MANFVKNIACPKCRQHGRDRKGNNLGTWDDGSKWCWSCGYYELPKHKSILKPLERPTRRLNDLVATIPLPLYESLLKRGLTASEIKYYYRYSPSQNRAVFIGFDDFQEARSWVKEPKSVIFGKKPYEFIYSDNLTFSDWCVIVEDAISAIKVSRYCDCMPLFGDKIPDGVVGGAMRWNKKVAVWLDFDKAKESYGYVRRFKNLMIESMPIVTKQDPKDHPDIEQLFCDIFV